MLLIKQKSENLSSEECKKALKIFSIIISANFLCCWKLKRNNKSNVNRKFSEPNVPKKCHKTKWNLIRKKKIFWCEESEKEETEREHHKREDMASYKELQFDMEMLLQNINGSQIGPGELKDFLMLLRWRGKVQGKCHKR